MERVAGIEPASSAWKAAALPLCYTRETPAGRRPAGSPHLSPVTAHFGLGVCVVGEVGLEPTKAMPADLQSAPFAARDIPPCAHRLKPGFASSAQQAERSRRKASLDGPARC